VNLNFRRLEKSPSIVVRARQVIPALPANEFATHRLQPLRTYGAETDGLVHRTLPLAGIHANCALIPIYLRSWFHGPKVIAQPG